MVRPNKNTEGDNRYQEIGKALRTRIRQTAFNTPKFRKLIREVWDAIMLFSQKDQEININLICSTTKIRKQYIEAAIQMLDKAGKLKYNKEKETIKVIYK